MEYMYKISFMKSCLLSVCFLMSLVGKTIGQCNAGFTYTVNQGMVSFSAATNLAQQRHIWYFGDGNVFVYSANTTHTYAQSGAYTVSHIVIDSVNSCTDTSRQTINVELPVSCNVGFTYTRQSYTSGVYNFYSQVNIQGDVLKQISWTIDGTVVSNQETFSHSFNQTGTYNVCIRIESVQGCVSEKCGLIQYRTDSSCTPAATFTWVAQPPSGRQVNFTALPDQPQFKYYWNFGDGQAGTGRNISHLYSNSGLYNVSLLVRDSIAGCISNVTRPVEITRSPADSCTVSFSYTISNGNEYYFTYASSQPVVSQLWSFAGINQYLNPVATTNSVSAGYIFPDTGRYRVCIQVQTQAGCSATYCDTITIRPIGARAAGMITSYPNPIRGENAVQLEVMTQSQSPYLLKVYNLSGNVVYQVQRQLIRGRNIVSVPVQQLDKGQYFITIDFNDKKMKSMFQKL